jgi:hypothetical protein
MIPLREWASICSHQKPLNFIGATVSGDGHMKKYRELFWSGTEPDLPIYFDVWGMSFSLWDTHSELSSGSQNDSNDGRDFSLFMTNLTESKISNSWWRHGRKIVSMPRKFQGQATMKFDSILNGRDDSSSVTDYRLVLLFNCSLSRHDDIPKPE